jgi:hypothetical protein
MKLLVLFFLLLAIAAFVQAERNGCYWHGLDQLVDWTVCIGKL